MSMLAKQPMTHGTAIVSSFFYVTHLVFCFPLKPAKKKNHPRSITCQKGGICHIAKATNPPPDLTPQHDLRPQFWVEMSKTGDAWVLTKDGYSACIGNIVS